jgi:hypothetical protein
MNSSLTLFIPVSVSTIPSFAGPIVRTPAALIARESATGSVVLSLTAKEAKGVDYPRHATETR